MKRGATLKVVLGRRFVVRPSSEKETCQLGDFQTREAQELFVCP